MRVDAGGASGSDTNVARVARGAGISTAGQGVGRVLGYLSLVAIAQLFGATVQGFYTAGVAVVNGAQILSRFGLENGVVRYVAHYRAEGDGARVKGTIVQAIAVATAISLVLSAIMFLGAGFAEGWRFRDYSMVPVLRAFAAVLPFFTFMSMVLWATQGFSTVTYASYVQQMIRPFLFLLLVPAFYLLTDDVVGIIAAYGVSMVLGAVAGVYFLLRLFPPLLDTKAPMKFETRSLFSVSVPMSVTTGAQYLNTWGATLVLGFFAVGPAVAIFNNAARTATLSTIVRFAFSGIFSPIISSLYSQGNMEELGRLYRDIARWVFTGALAIFFVILLLSGEILAVFGEEYTVGVVALLVVAFAQLFSSSVGPTPRMLAMTDNQNVVMVATAAAAVVGLATSVALVWGAESLEDRVLGAALGMACGIVVENTATLIAVRRRLGFWPYDRQWTKPLAAGLLAAAAAYGLGLLVDLPAIPAILLIGSVFGLIYLALLLLFGLSATDREFLAAFVDVAKRTLRRGRGDS
jgi:O-antigen/teichoic acid export membrane protein